MKKIFCLVSLCWYALSLAAPGSLIVSFDGKGTAMAWDYGVMQSLTRHLPADAISEVYLVGASSGALTASYFACHGVSVASAQEAIAAAGQDNPARALNENSIRRAMRLLLGLSTEASLDTLTPMLDQVTDQGRCLPAIPLLISAANLEVVDGRVPGQVFSGRRGRVFDRGRYELSENGQQLGKACTYFVNESMARILHDVDAHERLCDLRYIRTPADLRLAILASLVEPTYYLPIPEPDPTQLESVYPPRQPRRYGGGSILNSPLQDVKRARPDAWALGTGRPPFTRMENRVMHNWFSFYVNETLLDARWWFDAQIPIDAGTWQAMHFKRVTIPQQIEWGERAAELCFTTQRCTPALATKPLFSTGVARQNLENQRGRDLRTILH